MTGPRQNEYFIPGDGISREVIQADICRYLGNDALVRPGNHNVRFPTSIFLWLFCPTPFLLFLLFLGWRSFDTRESLPNPVTD